MSNELYQEIFYGNGKFKVLDEFFNTKEIVYNIASRQNLSGGFSSLTAQAEKILIGNRSVLDLSATNTVRQPVYEFTRLINITSENLKTFVAFNIDTVATVVQKGNRSGCVVIRNVHVTGNTAFEVKNRFLSYNNESFSIALKLLGDKNTTYWVSIGVVPSSSGIKGKADAVIKLVDNTHIIVDNLAKYMNVEQLLRGMTP